MKELLTLLLMVAMITCRMAFAQSSSPDKNHANIWYFGLPGTAVTGYPGLDFSSGTPVVLTNGKGGGGGISTSCDAQGNLQLYVVARNQSGFILNANHDTLHNSQNMFYVPLFSGALYGHTQRFLIVPNPLGNGLVYLFTSGAKGDTATFEYSVIDMNQQGSLGSVIEKNHFLYFQPTGKLTAVHHANCNDIWVVSHAGNSNDFYAYLVTDSGVAPNPVVSSAGEVLNIQQGYGGDMKLSPNGKNIAFVSKTFRVIQLFDFDNHTGIVSNSITLPSQSLSENSLSFSPDGTKLYISNAGGSGEPGKIVQYDVSLGDSALIVSSAVLIEETDIGVHYGFFGMEIGLDGKIYIAKFASSPLIDSLAVIHNPNASGAVCNFQLHAVGLQSRRSGQTLNNLIQSYFNQDSSAYKCFTGTGDELIEINAPIRVSPNPFSDKIVVSFSQLVNNCHVILYDASGKVLINKKESQVISIELSGLQLPDGMYILKIQGENLFYTCKLLSIHSLKN